MTDEIKFSQIPINHNEVVQSDLNIDDKVRSNLFSWNGQFSPQFVESLLTHYANSNDFVVDPFLGSGTVLGECARKGIKAYGIELNASAFYMAKTYEIANLNTTDRQALLARVDAFITLISNKSSIIDTITSEINVVRNSAYGNLLATLVILLDIHCNEVSLESLHKKWKLLKQIISKIPYSSNSIIAEHGDARKSSLSDCSGDLLITSPPYINVFNYHQKYRRSVETLGFNVLSTAKTEIGSNRKNRGNRLLTIIQYCIDMALSLKEASRICKDNARMIYVVGRESSVLGYSFCNSELIYNIATQIFSFSLILRQERVFKNRFGQAIYEDILHFTNHHSSCITNEEIIELARQIAIQALNEKLALPIENKNRPLLVEAIEKASKISPSEELK